MPFAIFFSRDLCIKMTEAIQLSGRLMVVCATCVPRRPFSEQAPETQGAPNKQLYERFHEVDLPAMLAPVRKITLFLGVTLLCSPRIDQQWMKQLFQSFRIFAIGRLYFGKDEIFVLVLHGPMKYKYPIDR